MHQLILFLLQAFTAAIAHPLAGELDYLSFSLLPNENPPANPSPENPGAYGFDLFYDPIPSGVEMSYPSDIVPSDSTFQESADLAQPNSNILEPLTPSTPVSFPSVPLDQEITNTVEQPSQSSQFTSPGTKLALGHTPRICARGETSTAKGAVCEIVPQCEGGKTGMCCSKMTEFGRPTECTPCLFYLDGFLL
jgi:hypothetical protein